MWTPQEILTFHIHATEFNLFCCVLSFKVSSATFLLQLQRFRARQKKPLRDLSLQIGETGGNVAVSMASAVARLALAPHGGMHSPAIGLATSVGQESWERGGNRSCWIGESRPAGGGDNGLPTPADLLTSRAELERKVTSRQLEQLAHLRLDLCRPCSLIAAPAPRP